MGLRLFVNIKDSLSGIETLYVETAPMIYFVEENPAYIDKMDFLMNAVAARKVNAISSTLILTEVLVHPLKEKNVKLVNRYRSILLKSRDFQLVPVTPAIAESAAECRSLYNLRTPDALHIATALDSKCDAFLTNDLGLKRVRELNIIVLADLDISDSHEKNI